MNTYNNLFGEDMMSKRIRTDHHSIIVCGHRGGTVGFEPENTLRAFERAVDIGLQAIECDVSIK